MLGYDEIMEALVEHVVDIAADADLLGDPAQAAMMGPLGYGVETTGLVKVAKEFAHVPIPGASKREAQAMAFVAGFQVAARIFAAREETRA